MKKFSIPDINTAEYWDTHQTATDFGLRQETYLELAGKGKSICEFGCGLSPFLEHARKKFIMCWGVDFSPETIKTARRTFPKVDYVLSSVTETNFPDKFFEVTVAGEVIEHLTNPQDLIDEMVRVTKRKIIISTPNLEFDDPEHLWEFTEDDLHELLEPFGKTEVTSVYSQKFPGRKYIFATCELS